jgi:hypothetical protein
VVDTIINVLADKPLRMFNANGNVFPHADAERLQATFSDALGDMDENDSENEDEFDEEDGCADDVVELPVPGYVSCHPVQRLIEALAMFNSSFLSLAIDCSNFRPSVLQSRTAQLCCGFGSAYTGPFWAKRRCTCGSGCSCDPTSRRQGSADG